MVPSDTRVANFKNFVILTSNLTSKWASTKPESVVNVKLKCFFEKPLQKSKEQEVLRRFFSFQFQEIAVVTQESSGNPSLLEATEPVVETQAPVTNLQSSTSTLSHSGSQAKLATLRSQFADTVEERDKLFQQNQHLKSTIEELNQKLKKEVIYSHFNLYQLSKQDQISTNSPQRQTTVPQSRKSVNFWEYSEFRWLILLLIVVFFFGYWMGSKPCHSSVI